jgi:hypothetical protein
MLTTFFVPLPPDLHACLALPDEDERGDLMAGGWGRDESWEAPLFLFNAALPFLSGVRAHETVARSHYEYRVGSYFVEKLYADEDG